MEAELEDARRQLREAQRRHEADTEALTPPPTQREATQALSGDHDQVTQAHAALQDELQRARRGPGVHARGAGRPSGPRRGGCATASPSSRRRGSAAPAPAAGEHAGAAAASGPPRASAASRRVRGLRAV